jgi:betaine-aldehyde dehydrogenase
MRIFKEEIFGPVVGVVKWSNEAAMFEQVNSVEYGLTASIWTNDLTTAHRAAANVEAGFLEQQALKAPVVGFAHGSLIRTNRSDER